MTQITESIVEDELSLQSIYEALRQEVRLLTTCTGIFALAGLVTAFLLPVKSQARTSFQMAMVANMPIEAPATLLEKLKQPLFYSGKTLKICGLNETDTARENLIKALNPTISKNVPIVTITYKAQSTEQAKDCLARVIRDIQDQQDEIAAPLITALNSQLNAAKEKLAIAERLKKQLAGQNLQLNFTDPKFSASVLMLSTMLSKETEAKELGNQITDLTLKLAEPQTRKASTLTEIYAPTEKSDPPRALISAAGALMGLLIGVMAAFLKRQLKISHQ